MPPQSPNSDNSRGRRLSVNRFLEARLSPDGFLGLYLTVGAVVLLLAISVFAILAEDVLERGSLLVVLDARVMLWMQTHATPGRTVFFLFVTQWHNTLGILIMTALLTLWLAYRRLWTWVLVVMLSVPPGMLLNMLLKGVFQRHRPVFIEPLLTLQTYSFPSGHTAASTLLYGVLAAWLLTTLKRPWHAPVLLLAACMVALVALSRVYLGAHYPSDVFAAMASSMAWLAIVLTGVNTTRQFRLLRR